MILKFVVMVHGKEFCSHILILLNNSANCLLQKKIQYLKPEWSIACHDYVLITVNILHFKRK